MPDHIHLIIALPEHAKLGRIVGDWKKWLTQNHKIVWQEDFFDHRLRHDESSRDKGDYILHNPVRAGLVDQAQDWPYVLIPR